MEPGSGQSSNSAIEIFMLARSFADAAICLKRQWLSPTTVEWDLDRSEWHRAMPFFVTGSFATELFLKCLHTIDTGVTPQGHKLRDLVNGLGTTTRARL